MIEDQEIGAMKNVASALEPLDDAARLRILTWAASRYGGKPFLPTSSPIETPTSGISNSVSSDAGNYETFAELFAAANPEIEREKALLAAFWVQVCLGQASFASQTLNSELKDLGHGVSNITDALTQLKSEKPALVLQLKKSGTSKQARKTYKLTQEGIKRVMTMVNRVVE
jgi:hypothetical protein